jgi:hypothetical protein
MTISREFAALEAGEFVSVTVTITRNQLSARPRGAAAAKILT